MEKGADNKKTTKDKKHRELNIRQKKFCLEYIKSNNATQSAINAGYSEKTAKSIGQRLLTFVHIKEYISKHTEKVLAKAGMEAEEIILLMTKFARQEMFEEEIHTKEITEDGKETIRKKKTVSLNALQLLAKYRGLENIKENKEVENKPLVDQFFENAKSPASERGIDL